MSLLMEALRKAEEAKSKASKEDASQNTAGTENAPADAPLAADFNDAATPAAKAHTETPEETIAGPAVINPDPDEEEILAAHSPERLLELVEREENTKEAVDDSETEQVEFTSYIAPETPADDAPLETYPAEEDAESEFFSEDDGLSLLQSSYFSRTKNTGRSSLEDEFPDTSEEQPEVNYSRSSVTESANESAQQASLATPPDEDTTPAEPIANEPQEAPSPDTSRADNKAQEKNNRDSASALFLAKEDSHKRRLKKLVSVAAIVLLFPLAGIVYWLFTSLNSSSDMQFNVQANNLANRSFSDSFVTQAEAPVSEATAETNAQAESQTGTVPVSGTENSSNQSQQLVSEERNGTDSPDTGLLPAQPTSPAPDTLTPAGNDQVAAAVSSTPNPGTQPAPRLASSTPAQNATTNNTVTASAPTSQSAAQEDGLSFTRTAPEQIINPDLNAAYDSYQQGDYSVASRLYQQVLQNEPNNRDAMLHLASVSLKQGNAAMAQNLYTRLLELNPRDPLARAGLLDTVQGDPVRQETELKSLISAYPDTAQLSFALGNLYASQNRWNEAQSAYFNALLAAKSNSTGPVSPDYAFNLAISLERINQLRAALDYYREAKALSGTTSPGFNPTVLDQRLTVLEQRLR